jgi:DNA-binding transcriptional regulator YiaG
MEKKKRKTFIFEALGIPIKLVNVPMKKVLGEWCIDIDMNKLMRVVLVALVHKPTALFGNELGFIRSYLKMTTTEFGKIFGVTHTAVLKWENNENQISPALDLYIRFYILDHLCAKDKEFRSLYHELPLEKISKKEKGKIHPIRIDAQEDLKIAL